MEKTGSMIINGVSIISNHFKTTVRQLTIILSLLWTVNCSGQVVKRLNAILATKDFIQFNAYVDSIQHDTLATALNGTRADWTYLREVTKGYREGVIVIEKMTRTKLSKTTANVNTYRVQLLIADNKIFFYDLTEKKNKREHGEWVPTYKPIDNFNNDSLFNAMTESFQQTFQTSLDKTSLFLTTIYFGCGISRSEIDSSTYRRDKLALVKTLGGNSNSSPPENKQIDKFVMDQDKASLFQWLQSTNTEKQIYAVYGFYKLKQYYGVSPTDQELKLITVVLQKRGTMLTRCGCEFGYENISNVTDKLKF